MKCSQRIAWWWPFHGWIRPGTMYYPGLLSDGAGSGWAGELVQTCRLCGQRRSLGVWLRDEDSFWAYARACRKGQSVLDNEETNLVTCCHRCNSARGKRSWKVFATKVAGYINHGVKAASIVAHITKTRMRPLPLEQAAEMIARRGGFSAALAGAAKEAF